MTSQIFTPRNLRPIIIALLPLILWLILTFSLLPGSLRDIGNPGSGIAFLGGIRAALPLIAVFLAIVIMVFKMRRQPPNRVLFLGPLGLAAIYGLVGVVASPLSPDGSMALYWAVSYVSVPLVLWSLVWGPNPIELISRIVTLNWLIIVLASGGLFAFALIKLNLSSFILDPSSWIECNTQGWFHATQGLPHYIRGTAVGRYGALAAILALSLIWQPKLRPFGVVIFLASLILLISSGARTPIVGFAVAAPLVVVLSGGKTTALAFLAVIAVLTPVVWATGLHKDFLNDCIFRSAAIRQTTTEVRSISPAGFTQATSSDPVESTSLTPLDQVSDIQTGSDSSETLVQVTPIPAGSSPSETLVQVTPIPAGSSPSETLVQVTPIPAGSSPSETLVQVTPIPAGSSPSETLVQVTPIPAGSSPSETLVQVTPIPAGSSPSETLVQVTPIPAGSSPSETLVQVTPIPAGSSPSETLVQVTPIPAGSSPSETLVQVTPIPAGSSPSETLVQVTPIPAGSSPSETLVQVTPIPAGSSPSETLVQVTPIPAGSSPSETLVQVTPIPAGSSPSETLVQVTPIPAGSSPSETLVQVTPIPAGSSPSETLVRSPGGINIPGIGRIPSGFFSFTGRLEVWRQGLSLFSKSPLLGYGFHADRILLGTHAHNALVHSLLQTGLIGTIPFVAALLTGWIFLFKCIRRLSRFGEAQKILVIQTVGIFAFLSIRSITESTGAFFGVDWLILAPLLLYVGVANRAPPMVGTA